MPKAMWNEVVIAESEDFETVEGNIYFPPESLKREFFHPSANTYTCSWKGTCNYYDLVVDGRTNANAAWVYPNPLPAAAKIAGMFAFWKGVEVDR